MQSKTRRRTQSQTSTMSTEPAMPLSIEGAGPELEADQDESYLSALPGLENLGSLEPQGLGYQVHHVPVVVNGQVFFQPRLAPVWIPDGPGAVAPGPYGRPPGFPGVAAPGFPGVAAPGFPRPAPGRRPVPPGGPGRYPRTPTGPGRYPQAPAPPERGPIAPRIPPSLLPHVPVPEPRPTDPQARARASLDEAPPESGHAMVDYMEGLRSELAAEGLPTSAEGVRMHVVDMGQHGDAVVRSAAGEVGPGRGADVRQYEVDSFDTERFDLATNYDPHRPMGRQLDDMLLNQANTSLTRASVLDTLTEQKLAEGRSGTELVNMSWGAEKHTALDMMLSKLDEPDSVPSQTARELIGSIDHEALAYLRPVTEADLEHGLLGAPDEDRELDAGELARAQERKRVSELLLAVAEERAVDGPVAEQVQYARSRVDEALTRSREAGLLTFAATGNERAHAEEKELHGDASKMDVHHHPDLVGVGALDTNDWTTPADDTMADFSSSGPQLVAPGVDIPIATPFMGEAAFEESGSSFASPWAMGVAGLMLKANPDLSPDELHALLLDNTRDVEPGSSYDGQGALEPVAAVRAAKESREP